MLRKKNAPKLTIVTDEDARKAEAARQITRTFAKYAAIKVGVTAAVCIAVAVIARKLEETEAESED